MVNVSGHKKCILLSNKKCEVQPTLINLDPNEYSQELHYYPFAAKLDRCVASWNILYDLSNKTEDLNLSVFNMIKKIKESKTLTKRLPCKCKYKFDDRKCNL